MLRFSRPLNVISAVLLLACDPLRALSDGPVSHPAEPSAFAQASPESVGISNEKVQAVLAGVRELIDDDEAVGAEVLLIKDQKIILYEVVGWRDREDRLPMRPDTICCVRSMTKPLIGTAIQMLIDDGKLTPNDAASKYLPSFDNPKSRKITIEQLLTHTAGFPQTLIKKELKAFSAQRAIADQAGQIGPSGKTGEFSYSDSDTETLTAIVSEVSGQPAEEFLRKRIFDPLGMKATYCVLGKDSPPRSQVSSNYVGSTGFWNKYWDRNDPPLFPYFLGAASLYTTPRDYARFLTLWMDGGRVGDKRLLSEDAIKRALRPAIAMRTPEGTGPMPTGFPGLHVFYGQHWMVYDEDGKENPATMPRVFGHGGSDGTLAVAFPNEHLMAFYFTQARGGLSLWQFESLIAPLAGMPARPNPQHMSVNVLKRYTGQYRNKSGEFAFIFLRGNRLAVQTSEGAFIPGWPDPEGRWTMGPAASNAGIQFDLSAKPPRFRFLHDSEKTVWEYVPPAKDLPTVDQLMSDRRHKQGGEHLEALHSIRLEGKSKAGNRQFDASLVATDDGRLQRHVKLGNADDILVVNPDGAWHKVPGMGLEKLSGAAREQYTRATPFSLIGDWRHSPGSMEVVRKDKVGDEDVWVVRIQQEFLAPMTRYVACKSGLLLKEEGQFVFRGITVPRITKFEDCRDVAGVQIPFRIISQKPPFPEEVVQYEKATANPKFSEGTFSKPVGKK